MKESGGQNAARLEAVGDQSRGWALMSPVPGGSPGRGEHSRGEEGGGQPGPQAPGEVPSHASQESSIETCLGSQRDLALHLCWATSQGTGPRASLENQGRLTLVRAGLMTRAGLGSPAWYLPCPLCHRGHLAEEGGWF